MSRLRRLISESSRIIDEGFENGFKAIFLVLKYCQV